MAGSASAAEPCRADLAELGETWRTAQVGVDSSAKGDETAPRARIHQPDKVSACSAAFGVWPIRTSCRIGPDRPNLTLGVSRARKAHTVASLLVSVHCVRSVRIVGPDGVALVAGSVQPGRSTDSFSPRGSRTIAPDPARP